MTQSGRTVALRIFTQAHNADKTEFAMRSLKAAMKWDEERYGLEYDLDLFNIVAVDDFNMVREQRAVVALCCCLGVMLTQPAAPPLRPRCALHRAPWRTRA